jgi:TPR repeat protein
MSTETKVIFLVVLTAMPCFAEKFALVIGVAGYPSFPNGEQVRYAGRDAESFAAFIETPQGGSFPKSNVHLLTNSNASRADLYREFDWLFNIAGPNDLVYVFFAGHGMEYRSRGYFLPYDASKERPDDRGIPMGDFLQKTTRDLLAKQVVVFIDACHSAAATEGARAPLSVDVEREWRALNQKQGQFSMALFSSSASQKSWEDPDLGGGHGLFTWYLLEGLQGGAAQTSRGLITANNLWNYVREKVEERSRNRFHEVQTPLASADFKTDFVLGCHGRACTVTGLGAASSLSGRPAPGGGRSDATFAPQGNPDAQSARTGGAAEENYGRGKALFAARDYSAARESFEAAADAGSSEAMTYLGYMYDNGRGAAQDYAIARAWYERASAAGSVTAKTNLGILYANGHGLAAPDPVQARSWYEKAAAGKDANAMNHLAVLYAEGSGVERNYPMAFHWYQAAANLGDSNARYQIGILYEAGKGVSQSTARARDAYRIAAQAGNTLAMKALGDLYRDGRGVDQDYTTALQWYKKAADAGDVGAMFALGVAYEEGRGVRADHAQAVQWYEKAAAGGNEDARKRVHEFVH